MIQHIITLAFPIVVMGTVTGIIIYRSFKGGK